MVSKKLHSGSAPRSQTARAEKPLTEAQQSELVMKLRFGIGLEQLMPADEAARARANLPARRHEASRRTGTLLTQQADREGDAAAQSLDEGTRRVETSKAIARLGRGHGLGRGWRP